MKRNSSLAKIFLAAILFQSHFAVADNFGQQTNSDVNSAAEFQPLVCQMVPSPYFNSENGGTAPMVQDPNCVAENNRRANALAQARNVQAQTARLSSGDGTNLVAPKAPEYTCGSMDQFSQAYQSCQASYNSANSQYQKDLSAYNQAQQGIQSAQTEAEKSAMAAVSGKSATETLAEIKNKNDEGKKSFDITALITMGLGVAATVKGTVCVSQCPMMGGGCCSQAPIYFITAAAMFLMNSKAKKQSAEHAASSVNACQSMNQLSSTPTDCSKTTSGQPIDTTGTPIVINPATGECTPAESDACKQAPKVGVATGSLKDGLKNSAFASGNMNDAFKLMPDGSVKLKNGKTYKDSDFKDLNSLMATGLTAAQAKQVMDSLGNNGAYSKLASDLKETKKSGSAFGGTLGADGTTTYADTNKNPTSDKKYTDELGEKKDGDKFSDDRKPSSEGLAKEFNGELIGVAGDDIFLMMNRRYKLKSEQDSFIVQERK